MKIRIGENEYEAPFRELDDEEMDEVWVMDANNNYVKVESVIAALNELASLRQERDALVKRVEELEKMIPKQGESVLRELFPDPKGGDNEV